MKLWQAAAGQGDARAQCNLGNVRADGRGAAKNEARGGALQGDRRDAPHPPRLSAILEHAVPLHAAPNAVNDWDAGFDVRAYATHGVMHGGTTTCSAAPCRRRSTRTLASGTFRAGCLASG